MKDIHFGMPTLIELDSVEACAALCRELGLAFVELNMNLPEYQAENLDTKRLLNVADDYGVFYTIHLDENMNPCDFNNKVAMAYAETVLQTIETAQELHAPILNMHMNSGVYFTLPNRKVYLFEEYEREYLYKLSVFRDACNAAVVGSNIKICVENCGDFAVHPCVRKGLDILLQSSVFAMTYDIGHSAAADYSDEPVISEHISRLCHMHIHDARGRSNHLVLGEGDVEMQKYLSLAQKHDCRVVIEVKTVEGLRRSVSWLKEMGVL